MCDVGKRKLLASGTGFLSLAAEAVDGYVFPVQVEKVHQELTGNKFAALAGERHGARNAHARSQGAASASLDVAATMQARVEADVLI